MAGGKQTPRQKLIGLMYLIFLALMAMNVSVQVLDAFPLIDRGIQETNSNFEMKIDMIYDDFNAQIQNFSEEHVYPFHGQALYIRGLADSLISYIMTNRTEMLAELNNMTPAEADTLPLEDSKRKDNYSVSTRFWMEDGGSEGGPGTRSYILREMIQDYKDQIDSILALHDQSIQLGLDLDGPFDRQGAPITWQTYNFERVISVAVATNLSRFVTEIRNAQFDAISMLYDLIHAGQFRFDQVEARIVPESRIIMQGDRFRADVFVAAMDTREQPTIYVGNRQIPVRDGIGRIDIPATSPGEHTISGNIVVRSPAGVTTTHPFRDVYTVQSPMASVSAIRMNALYVGVDNPIRISAAGVTSDQLRPEISVGTITPQPDGTFIARLPAGTTGVVNINVYARDGAATSLIDTQEFRAMTLPTPLASVGGERSGGISRERLRAARSIRLKMPEDFLFDANYEIESFVMSTTIRGLAQRATSNSNRFTDEMISMIENTPIGQDIGIRDIITKPGPDGKRVDVDPLIFTIR